MRARERCQFWAGLSRWIGPWSGPSPSSEGSSSAAAPSVRRTASRRSDASAAADVGDAGDAGDVTALSASGGRGERSAAGDARRPADWRRESGSVSDAFPSVAPGTMAALPKPVDQPPATPRPPWPKTPA